MVKAVDPTVVLLTCNPSGMSTRAVPRTASIWRPARLAAATRRSLARAVWVISQDDAEGDHDQDGERRHGDDHLDEGEAALANRAGPLL